MHVREHSVVSILRPTLLGSFFMYAITFIIELIIFVTPFYVKTFQI